MPGRAILVSLRRRLKSKRQNKALLSANREPSILDDEDSFDWVTARSTMTRKSTIDEQLLNGTSLAGASTDDGEPESGETGRGDSTAEEHLDLGTNRGDRPAIPAGAINATVDWGKYADRRTEWPACTCGWVQHTLSGFSSEIPLVTPPGIEPGSYTEMLCHAKSICGHWVTILPRSQSLDPQMQHIGISRLKRAVMNKLAIPFSARLESNNTILHAWITTPLGPKHMQCGLIGQTLTDVDSEVGTWVGVSKMVDFSIPWFCGGKPIRAIQLKRTSEEHGLAYETRVVIPDKEEGKILLFNIKLYPKEPHKDPIFVDRILKFTRPFTDKELEE